MYKIDLSKATLDEIIQLEKDIEIKKYELKKKKIIKMRIKNFDSYENGFLSVFNILDGDSDCYKEASYSGYKRIPIRYKIQGGNICDAYEPNEINKLRNIEFPINDDNHQSRVTIRLLQDNGTKVLDIGDSSCPKHTSISLDVIGIFKIDE